ncbi:MAG: GIY-YIG nuclease family protein [Candidatus Bathyarchaeia archaeon]
MLLVEGANVQRTNKKRPELPEQRTYTLLISVSTERKIDVGKLGQKTFLPGYYVYTGSASGKGATSIHCRLARHLRTVKKKHWHIDFLLADKNATIEALAVIASNKQDIECQTNRFIGVNMKSRILIPKFGASDCRNKCGSHLLYLGSMDVKQEIRALLKKKFGENCGFLDSSEVFPIDTSKFPSKLKAESVDNTWP